MNRIPVQSSNLKSVGHDPATNRMEVEFVNGRIGVHEAVPRILYDGLLFARSKGEFYSSRIAGNKFRYTEITKEK